MRKIGFSPGGADGNGRKFGDLAEGALQGASGGVVGQGRCRVGLTVGGGVFEGVPAAAGRPADRDLLLLDFRYLNGAAGTGDDQPLRWGASAHVFKTGVGNERIAVVEE